MADVVCNHCNRASLRRSSRQGFAEKFLFALAGYYPWRCAYCKRRQMLRVRGDSASPRAAAMSSAAAER